MEQVMGLIESPPQVSLQIKKLRPSRQKPLSIPTTSSANIPVDARSVLVGLGRSAAATLLDSIQKRNLNGNEKAIRTEWAVNMAKHLDQYVERFIQSRKPQEQPEIRSRAHSVKIYFLENDEGLGMTPLERMAQVYEHLPRPNDPTEAENFESAVRTHMAFLVEKSFDQHFVNPQEYLSHGFEHSLRVVNYSDQVVEALPQIVEVMTRKYAISEGEARFMIDQVALLHDIGYPQLYGNDKAAHSIVGARMVDNQEHVRLIWTMIQTPGAQTANLIHDFRDAILFHNADKFEQIYSARIETAHGRFLAADIDSILDVISTFTRSPQEFDLPKASSMRIFVSTEETKRTLLEAFRLLKHGAPEVIVVEDVFRGRSINLLQPKIQTLGLEFAQVDAMQSPLQAIIRIADNLDLLPERLSLVQQETAFGEICRLFGDNGDSSQALKQLEKLAHSKNAQASLETFKQQVIDSVLNLPEYAGLPKYRRDAIVRLALTQDSKQYRHIAGCLGLQEVSVQTNPQTQGLEIVIQAKPETYRSLQSIVATEDVRDEDGNKRQVDIPVSDYQIWRTQEAFKSLRVGGRPITVRVGQ